MNANFEQVRHITRNNMIGYWDWLSLVASHSTIVTSMLISGNMCGHAWFRWSVVVHELNCLYSSTEFYSVSGKKETKMFLVISPTKLVRFQWNFVYGFLNKFAIKWYKRFLPHLNNVSTLSCKTWNAHCARATIEFIQKETPEFIPSQLWPPIRQIWIQLITACRKYHKRRCKKYASLI